MNESVWSYFLRAEPWTLALISVATIGIAAGYGVYVRLKRARSYQLTDDIYGYKDVHRIAILIASKNGEQTIAQTIKAAKKNGRTVFVVSDGSTDRTAKEAKLAGAKVLALRKNIGKPSALHRAYRHFNISKNYDAVAILDDDVLIERDFIRHSKSAMGYDTAITVGRNITEWPYEQRWNMWLAARAYSYWCYQITQRRAQSAFNVMNCISGSNSLYRTEILDQVLRKKTPYIVDDTYWTLETHRMQLGKIVYAPRAGALIQDPTNFKDWYNQNLRWMWGTFQGIIGHQIGSEFNRFHMAYVLLMTEWVLYILSAPLCIWLLLQGGLQELPRQIITLFGGYALWVVAAALALKRPRLILFLPVIVAVDFIFRAVMVHAFVKALRQKTVRSCVWNSPKRIDKRQNTLATA